MASGTGPREAALDILRAVRTGKTFDRALDNSIAELSDVDRKLAHEIAAGVLRERMRRRPGSRPAGGCARQMSRHPPNNDSAVTAEVKLRLKFPFASGMKRH